jgi:hypothetical protein
MSDEKKLDDPVNAVGDGRMVLYELDGDKCEVHGFVLSDGGYSFMFKRNGAVYPLRLSQRGMLALIDIYSALWYENKPSAGKEAAP